MKKLLVKLIKNKRNGQINLSIPKRKIKSEELKKKIMKSEKAWISLEGFE